MTAAALDTARLLAGFAVGVLTARAAAAPVCAVCGRPAPSTGVCDLCAPIINPPRRTR